MIMAALGNELRNDRMRHYFAQEIEAAIRPLLEWKSLQPAVAKGRASRACPLT